MSFESIEVSFVHNQGGGYVVSDTRLLGLLFQFARRAAASEISQSANGQRPATSNGHKSSVELEILKELKEENDQMRDRLLFCR